MASESRLGRQVAQVAAELRASGVSFALIGGLALASHNVMRATSDVDLLADVNDAASIDGIVTKLGYHSIYRSADVGNYLRNDERLDLLFASRPIARRLLAQARAVTTVFGELPVVSAEGLVGLKLQALANDPRRTRDMDDIRELLIANRKSLNVVELREYFLLFDQEDLLDELLK